VERPVGSGDPSSSQQQQQTSFSVAASPPPRCHGDGEDSGELGNWESQRWRHWQQMTMMNSFETNEQQTLV